MKEYLGDLFVLLLALAIFWPWCAGLLDLSRWAATGAQMTSIPWGQARGVACVLWPFGGLATLYFVLSVFG